MPTILEELRNSAADRFYANASGSSAVQDAPATSSAAQGLHMQVDYDEEDPNLPGSPVVDQPPASESSAIDALMLNEIAAQYNAFRDPVCSACNSSFTAGMVTCPTCDAVQNTQLTPVEEQLAIQDAVQSSRAEFSLAWMEDHSYRGTRATGSHADFLQKGTRYLRARKPSEKCMGSPNDGNDAWSSCILRFDTDDAFKANIILSKGNEQDAREYLKRCDAAVQKGATEGSQHWSIAERKAFHGEETRFRLNLTDTAGNPVSDGVSTPAISNHPTYMAMIKGKAGKSKGKSSKDKGKSSKDKGKGKRDSGKSKSSAPAREATSQQEWLRPADVPGRTTEEKTWRHQEMALEQASERSKRQNTGASSSSAVNPESAPVIPPPPTRPRMFVDNDNSSPTQSSAPARAANTYHGYDVRGRDRPPPVQTAPASQPYYHAAPSPQHAEQPPEQWHGRNTDDQWRDQTGWDTWTQNEWQNGFQ